MKNFEVRIASCLSTCGWGNLLMRVEANDLMDAESHFFKKLRDFGVRYLIVLETLKCIRYRCGFVMH